MGEQFAVGILWLFVVGIPAVSWGGKEVLEGNSPLLWAHSGLEQEPLLNVVAELVMAGGTGWDFPGTFTGALLLGRTALACGPAESSTAAESSSQHRMSKIM